MSIERIHPTCWTATALSRGREYYGVKDNDALSEMDGEPAWPQPLA